MNDNLKLPAMTTAVYSTAAALIDLAVCLLAIANLSPATQSTQMPLIAGLVGFAMLLIALAAVQWVAYFRAYVDFRIDQVRQKSSTND